MLEQTFKTLAQKYTDNTALAEQLWAEIWEAYSEKGRHYHTLAHLQSLLHQLNPVQHLISDWDAVQFAVFYHDLVYNPIKQDNEARSAALAAEYLAKLGVPPAQITRCKAHILATQGHQVAADADTNWFTDADLAILGQPWDIYAGYAAQVRLEYHIFPDLVYKPGRRKVLSYFLQLDTIYKTDYFQKQYEQQARANLNQELKDL